jgi:hypothetical protein
MYRNHTFEGATFMMVVNRVSFRLHVGFGYVSLHCD